MAHITKNANTMLLFLVVLTITFLVGATVFYQTNLASINKRYNEKVGNLRQVEKELNVKIQILEQIREDLKLQTAREETFTEKYTEIRGEKETLESEKTTLESEKESLESSLDKARNDKRLAENRLALEEARAIKLAGDFAECEDDLNDAKNQVDYYYDQLQTCEGN